MGHSEGRTVRVAEVGEGCKGKHILGSLLPDLQSWPLVPRVWGKLPPHAMPKLGVRPIVYTSQTTPHLINSKQLAMAK